MVIFKMPLKLPVYFKMESPVCKTVDNRKNKRLIFSKRTKCLVSQKTNKKIETVFT